MIQTRNAEPETRNESNDPNSEPSTIIQVTHSEFNAGFGNRVLHIFDGRIEEPENTTHNRPTEEQQAK